MRQGIVLLKKYVSTWKESSTLKTQLLTALCNLHLSDSVNSETGFSSIDISNEVKQVRGHGWAGSNDSDNSSSEVRKQWKLLLELWESKKTGVYQYLEENGVTKFPKLEKIEGGGSGIPSLYGIVWQDSLYPLHANKQNYPNAYDASALTYICEDIANPGLLARLFSKGIDLSGWRRYIFVAGISIPLLFGLIILIILMIQISNWDFYGVERIFQTFISIALFASASWLLIGSFIKLPDNRIVIAPTWMQSEFNDRLLEMRRSPVRSIKAVHYSAKCPICKGKVNAMSGRWEFPGRIVGRCENSPVEHIFSFDHVTRSGKSLRSLP